MGPMTAPVIFGVLITWILVVATFCHVNASPLVIPFPQPRSFGRPGLKHATLYGAVLHKAKHIEVWRQSFEKNTSTPIHSHDCEEVFVGLDGKGVLKYWHDDKRRVVEVSVGKDMTWSVPPKVRHQIVGTSAAPPLLFVVTFNNPPMKATTYQSWEPSDAGKLSFPYLFDRGGGDDNDNDNEL